MSNIIYSFSGGKGEYLLIREDEIKVYLFGVNSFQSTSVNKRELELKYQFKIKQLPYDMREWANTYRNAWAQYHRIKMVEFASKLKPSRPAGFINDELGNPLYSKEMVRYLQRTHELFAKAEEDKYSPAKVLSRTKSRRVKQRLARARLGDLSGLPKKQNGVLLCDKPEWKKRDVPQPSPNWPIRNLTACNLGQMLACCGTYGPDGRGSFLNWYQVEGKYLDLHNQELYRYWLGEENIQLHTMDWVEFYFRAVPKSELLPWNWPYLKRVYSPEESLALCGVANAQKVKFFEWFNKTKKIPYCGRHSSEVAFRCKKCAYLAYVAWEKNKKF